MENDDKRVYRNIADYFVKQDGTMYNEIIEKLQNISGNITYKEIANNIGGLATKNTIAKNLKSL